MASGLARPCPAMSGAEPCTGSNMPGPSPASDALGSMPIEPVSIAASSERMSPNMFSVRIVSKSARRGDELHGGVVDEHVLELDVGELARVQVADDLAPQPRGLEHVGLVDARDLRLADRSAAVNAVRAMRSISSVV